MGNDIHLTKDKGILIYLLTDQANWIYRGDRCTVMHNDVWLLKMNLTMATEDKNRHTISFFDLHSRIIQYKDSPEWQQLSFAAKVRTMIIELLTIRENENKEKS